MVSLRRCFENAYRAARIPGRQAGASPAPTGGRQAAVEGRTYEGPLFLPLWHDGDLIISPG